MIASIAEMASMFVSGHTGFAKESYIDLSGRAPTAGGQYHWVSEFAPRSIEKPLSYLVGQQKFFRKPVLLVWLPSNQLHRVVLLSGLGDGKPSFGSADVDTGSGVGTVEERRCQCRCSVANGSLHHDLHRRGRCLQYFSREKTPIGRGNISGSTRCRVFRLSDHVMGHGRPCPSRSGIYAVFGWRGMGQHGTFLLGRDHHPALVLPRT